MATIPHFWLYTYGIKHLRETTIIESCMYRVCISNLSCMYVLYTQDSVHGKRYSKHGDFMYTRLQP